MVPEDDAIEISNLPELQRLADAVRQSGKPLALKRAAETVAIVQPAPATRTRGSSPRHRRRAGVLTPEDSLWNIVVNHADDGPTDVSSNKHKYLAGAYTPKAG